MTAKISKFIRYMFYYCRTTYNLLSKKDWLKMMIHFFLRVKNGSFTIQYCGVPLKLRRGSQDIFVFVNIFGYQSHRPLKNLPETSVILDLGTNVGFSAVDYKLLYPKSTVFAVEMENQNYECAKANTSQLENVEILNFAVSTGDGDTVKYIADGHEDAFHTSTGEISDGIYKTVETISIPRIIEMSNSDKIAFVKMDIEGEEGNILNSTDLDWLKKVDQIHIELHPHLNELATVENAKKVLASNGFEVVESPSHERAIFAFNENTNGKSDR